MTQKESKLTREQLQPHVVQPNLKPKAGISNIIAVASGKGGVGKSTVSLHLALYLAKLGAKVGLLDADIHGPSQPLLLGHAMPASISSDKKIIPLFRHGIHAVSIGYLINDETPVVWRGPMVSGALLQLLNDTDWPELDYLIIDLPPGTGDIQLTLAQKIPLAGVVMVTTPQEVALIDVIKGIKMFQKVNVPLLGVVENMALHQCSACGHTEAIFGTGGALKLCEQFNLSLLGQLPLFPALNQQADLGLPWLPEDENDTLAQHFQTIAQETAAQVALRPIDYSAKIPPIVIK